ncbi:unnamed protein product [Rotaria sp. Silwood2]|nr:unnamed protein product [Rotaria sp. Silwood2]
MSIKEARNIYENNNTQQDTEEYSPFHHAILHSSVQDIKKMIDKGANLAEKTKNGDNILDLVEKRSTPNAIIKQILMCEYEKMMHLRELLKIDRSLIIEMAEIFDRIKQIFQTNSFLNRKILHLTHDEHDYHDLLQVAMIDKDVRIEEYELILHFRHISQLIGLLNRHDGSTKQMYNSLINWHVLQGIEKGLRSHSLWNENPGKLFQSISPDCLRLEEFFSQLTQLLNRFNVETDDLKQLTFGIRKCEYSVLTGYIIQVYDKDLAERSISIIDIVKTLTDFKEKIENVAMFHCIQLLGEISHSFSTSTQEQLKKYYFYPRLKQMRNEIKNHWENTVRAVDFLKDINSDVYENDLERMKEILIHFYKPLLNGIINNKVLLTVIDDKSRQNIDTITSSFKKLLEKKPDNIKDLNSTDITYINKQIELLVISINHILDIFHECKKHYSDEISIRCQLQKPQLHYCYLFYLTIIGSTVHNMRIKHVFLATVPVALHEKLDYLRWIRNSLMHYEIYLHSNFYRNTLFDYLSNDLLIEEYSIDLHGQVMVQFVVFFNELEKELTNYGDSVSKLSLDNYYTNYSNGDKKFYKGDIERKQEKINAFQGKLQNKYRQPCRPSLKLGLNDVLDYKDDIEEVCQKFNFEFIGIFGPLAKYGTTQFNKNSGFLVQTQVDNFDVYHDNLLHMKKYIADTDCLSGLGVVEIRQMREYLNYKRRENTTVDTIVNNIKRYSLKRLINGQELYKEIDSCIEYTIDDNSSKHINELFKKDVCYEYCDKYNDYPMLHILCNAVINRKQYRSKKRAYFRSIINRMLSNGAQINVQTRFDCTILHSIAREPGTGKISLHSLMSPEYHEQLDTNIFGLWHDAIPLSVALIENIRPLKYELGRLTNLCRHADELIIAAIQGCDLSFLMYLFHVLRDDQNQYLTLSGRYRNDGRTLLFTLLEQEQKTKNEFLDKNITFLFVENGYTYLDMINFLIENNIELRCKNGSYRDYEDLLMYLLLNRFHESALILLRRERHVDFFHGNDCPIHVALDNLIKCRTECERRICLQLTKQIIQNSDDLNFELHAGQDIPLYIAAKYGELEIVKILLQQTQKVNMNYKPHRYSHNMCCKAYENEYEIVILLLEHGLPIKLSKNLGSIKNQNLRTRLETCERLWLNYCHGTSKIGKDDQLFRIMHEDSILRRLIVNRRNERGENILYYAITRNDETFVRLILQQERPKMNLIQNHTINSKWPCDNTFYKSYIHHLARSINGQTMVVFVECEYIDWQSFNFIDMENMTTTAIKENDQMLFHCIEKYGYPIISFQYRKLLIVRMYVDAFRNLESPSLINNLSAITKLPNRRVLFQNKSNSNYRTLLATAILSNKLTIVRYLIEDLNDDIHAASYPLNYNPDVKRILPCFDIFEDHKISVLDDFIVSGHYNLEILRYLIDNQVRILDAKNFNRIARLPKDLSSQFRIYIDKNEEIRQYIFHMTMKHHLHDVNFIKFLLSLSSWNPNQYDNSGYTPLHCCAEKGYNETIRLLCESGRVDVELPTQNSFIFLTTGNRTPVGIAIEEKKFSSARLLVENYDASPYEYLLILLINALQKQDADYVQLLLQKSIVVNLRASWFFLQNFASGNPTLTTSIEQWELEQAIEYAKKHEKQLNIPNFILKQLYECQKMFPCKKTVQ